MSTVQFKIDVPEPTAKAIDEAAFRAERATADFARDLLVGAVPPDKRPNFPHANEVLRPVEAFWLRGKWLFLYHHVNRPNSHPYSLYWEGENNPVQHAMTQLEVFNVLYAITTKPL